MRLVFQIEEEKIMGWGYVSRKNGVFVDIEKEGYYYTYMVWQPSQAEAILNEFEKTGRTPTDIIHDAIEILKRDGCKKVSSLVSELGIRQVFFIVCKQADPLANNVLKMGKPSDGTMYVWLRGRSEGVLGLAAPRPLGTKTDSIVPLWNVSTAKKACVSTENDDYKV
jgi:hypothetical protein